MRRLAALAVVVALMVPALSVSGHSIYHPNPCGFHVHGLQSDGFPWAHSANYTWTTTIQRAYTYHYEYVKGDGLNRYVHRHTYSTNCAGQWA